MRNRKIQDALDLVADGTANSPETLLAIAQSMAADRPKRAVALAHRILGMAPEPSVADAAARLLKSMVPAWHFGIVRDHARNEAFEQALIGAVTPMSRVLDIGTGTGLLAMMAARAGARDVITCEKNAAVAAAAADVIAANGFADRIRLVDRHSSDLDLESDLGGPVDVLVSEIVSNDIVGQGCLPVMEQAAAWLAPDGRMIPEAGTVRVALAWSETAEQRRMGVVAGFDLSAFNALEGAPQQHKVGDPQLSIRSSAADLMHFDFRSGGPFPAREALAAVVADGRPVNGVVQWIRLTMDDRIVYENRPAPGATSCWAALFHPLAAPLACVPEQAVTIAGAHDRRSLRVWTEGTDGPGRRISGSPPGAAAAGREGADHG